MTVLGFRLIAVIAMPVLMLSSTVHGQRSEPNRDKKLFEDQPKVAIIQYESGRVLILREVNGELQVHEPTDGMATTLGRYLSSQGSTSDADPVESLAAADPVAEPLFFSPEWYSPYYAINTNPPGDRATEAAKQRSAEKRQQVRARRQQQGVADLTNRAGQVYPSTAADAEENRRLGRVQPQAGSAYATFYNLGYGLEYYRQQELAARRELALLSYDVLLDEGLQYFHERRYGQAARSFIAAAEKDHGDAGSRLHAGQALMASGLYSNAMVHVRRAFELSPQLINRPLNHRAAYTYSKDYDRHVGRLQQYVSDHPEDADAALLLAYELFFSGTPEKSRQAMHRVKALAEQDRFAWKLCRAARPVLGNL